MSDIKASVLMVPGWQGSSTDHWQSLWLARLPRAEQLIMDNWQVPRRHVWIEALSRQILDLDKPVVVVAHSLGCLALSHLPSSAAMRIAGALMVAPIDPEKRALFSDFGPVPAHRLPYRSIVVASTSDPCCSVRLSAAYARAWASEFVRIPNAGHINVASGHGPWPLGWALLQSLLESASFDSSLSPSLQAA